MSDIDNFPNYTAKKFPEYRQYLLTRDKMPTYRSKNILEDMSDDFDLLLKIPYTHRSMDTELEGAEGYKHFFTDGKQLWVIYERLIEKKINLHGKYSLNGIFPVEVAAWMQYCLEHNTDSFGDKYDWGVFELLQGELVDFHHTVSGYNLKNISRWRSDLSCDKLDLPAGLYNDPRFVEMWQGLAKNYPMKKGDVVRFDPENHLKQGSA